MSLAWLQEIRDRHYSDPGGIPEHHRDHPCDACRLLTLLDAQTKMLGKALSGTEKTDIERLAHKAAEIGFTYGALGRDFEYAYKNVNDMLAEDLAPKSEPPQTLGSQRTRR